MSDSRELSLVGLFWLTEEGEARGDLGMVRGMLEGRDGRIFKMRRKKNLGLVVNTRKEGPRPLKRPLWLADIMDNLSLDCRDAALRLTGLSRSRVGA